MGLRYVNGSPGIISQVDVIGLSTYGERSIINQMISNGAKGYLLKNVTESELIEAINKVYRGKYYYGSEIQQAMANTIFHTMGSTPRLTKREKQILKLIVSGKTTNGIAEELFISPLTVETHRRNLMKKTGCLQYGFPGQNGDRKVSGRIAVSGTKTTGFPVILK